MSESTTHHLDVPGASLVFDMWHGGDGQPPLLAFGSPMGASGFAGLVEHLAPRRVVTYDPRGVERSRRDDPLSQATPQMHADDIAAIVAELGGDPVDVFATSGGAVNALALVTGHPGLVRTLVAHEPPLATLVSDRDEALAASAGIRETYLRSGFGPAMAQFLALVLRTEPLPVGYAQQPGPDPAAFGLPTQDDGSRDDPLLGQNIVTSTHYEPDIGALRGSATRVVVAAGADSGAGLAARGARALARLLDVPTVELPGDHGSFLGPQGSAEQSATFARALQEALLAPKSEHRAGSSG